MSDRFYFPFDAATISHSSVVNIRGSEANHISKAMRLKVGDQVILFNGSGAQCTARLLSIERSQVAAKITDIETRNLEGPAHLSLAAALPKGDRQRFMIEKLTEVGLSEFIPINTRRATVHPKPNTIERLNRWVIEASKQCGRNRLLAIHEPMNLGDLLESTSGTATSLPKTDSGGWHQIVLHPNGKGMPYEQILSGMSCQDRVRIAVGPEGGFNNDEISAFQSAGWQVATVGPRILRVETAAIVAVSLAHAILSQ